MDETRVVRVGSVVYDERTNWDGFGMVGCDWSHSVPKGLN